MLYHFTAAKVTGLYQSLFKAQVTHILYGPCLVFKKIKSILPTLNCSVHCAVTHSLIYSMAFPLSLLSSIFSLPTFIFVAMLRCLTSVSICPSWVRLLYLHNTSFFAGSTHEVYCVCIKMAGLSVFTRSYNLYLFVSQLSAECQTTQWHGQFSLKPEVFCLCVYVIQPWLQKAWTCPVSDTCRIQTDSSSCFSLYPAAFITLLEGRHSGCSPWFECPRGRLLQIESNSWAVE